MIAVHKMTQVNFGKILKRSSIHFHSEAHMKLKVYSLGKRIERGLHFCLPNKSFASDSIALYAGR